MKKSRVVFFENTDTHTHSSTIIGISLLFSLGLLLLFIPLVSKAQTCPPNGFLGLTWSGSYTATEYVPDPHGGFCQVLVYYCTSGGDNPYIYIDGLAAESGCDDMSGDQIIKGAEQQLYLDPNVVEPLGVPPCNPKGEGWYGETVNIVLAACFEFNIIDIPPWFHIAFFTDCDQSAYCVLAVQECIANGVVQIHSSSATLVGTSDCSTMPPTWTPGQCYDILPCSVN